MAEFRALEPKLLAALSRILGGLPDAGPTLSGLLAFCARELESLVPSVHSSFAFAQDDPRALVTRTLPDDPVVPLVEGVVLVPASSPIISRLEAHEPTLVDLQEEAIGDAMGTLATSGFCTLLLVPLLADGQLLGTWNLASRRHDAFGSAEIDLLRHLGDVVSLAASRAHLQALVQQQTEQLVESEKLAAVGRLVAGVAHELGGPLQAVISLAEVLARNPERDDRLESANRILRSALRCRGMVHDLLTYARKQPHRLEPVQVSDAVMDALELDRFSDVGEIQVHLAKPDDLPAVMADAQRLTQVFLNLITNARHATPQDGRPGLVRVQLEQVPSSATKLELPQDTTVVQVSVEDQGPGVPEELRETIFEPFVTTKPQGSGTGLGLSVSKSIVMDMGGALYLDTAFSGGARFVVELPATNRPVSSVEARPISTAGGLRILLIDDDREVLETYEVILSLDDHEVTSCDRGRKALEILESDTFHAILCDVRLPDLRGPELLEELRVRSPELADRVIFATGDVVNDATRAFLASVPNPSLIKPFQVEDLQRAIARVAVNRA
jgi:signal transduction histidine kinase/ActR/RegA family two-component response regulator